MPFLLCLLAEKNISHGWLTIDHVKAVGGGGTAEEEFYLPGEMFSSSCGLRSLHGLRGSRCLQNFYLLLLGKGQRDQFAHHHPTGLFLFIFVFSTWHKSIQIDKNVDGVLGTQTWGRQDGRCRRIHWAMAAPQQYNFTTNYCEKMSMQYSFWDSNSGLY